jgi:hypothetical protein
MVQLSCPKEAKMAENMRHAVARSTGATTLARKGADGWDVTCLSHNKTVVVASRATAWTTSSHPQDWCPKCKAIAAGKGKPVTGDKVPVPARSKAKVKVKKAS